MRHWLPILAGLLVGLIAASAQAQSQTQARPRAASAVGIAQPPVQPAAMHPAEARSAGARPAGARPTRGPRPVLAAPPPPPPLDPGSQCRAAIIASEQLHGLPPGLLGAIARVESGRRDPNGQGVTPWPWTINAEGQGRYFESKLEAIAAVLELRARGVTVIDVGCMQVNLHHHPTAFATLDEAFDPAANARYGGLFLKRLASITGGDFEKAAGHYHSYTPDRAEAYRARVLAVWAGAPLGPPTTLVAGTVDPAMLQRVIRINGRNIRAFALNSRPDLTGERIAALGSIGVPLRLTGQTARGRPVFMVEVADGSVRPSTTARR
jgi:soluble lytic murein transglycosylase-like protein